MEVRIGITVLLFLATTNLSAQKLTNSDYSDYCQKYNKIAVREMELYKIPASITLAQGMIESGCGKSVLAIDSKNHFGIKCQKEWIGEKYYYDDDKPGECFRKYDNIDQSFRDHSLFLTTRARYASLFTLQITDYKGWATGLKQAGYATNPDYANMLIRLIESQQLYRFDDTLPGKKDEVALISTGDKINHAPAKQLETSYDEPVKKEGRILFRANCKLPESKDFGYLYTSDSGRKVYQNRNVPFIFAKTGDTWYNIADEFKIYSFQVYKQNDLLKTDPITLGQMLYLEPKKKKGSDNTYKVKKGDSMYSISQEKCVKLKRLRKYNKLQTGDEPKPGFELKLRK
jgi:hypothetical protein